jgi:hypothetical protein
VRKFVLLVVREIAIVWTDAKMDALGRREIEIFNSDAKAPSQNSIELQFQIEEITRVINDVVIKIELLNQKLGLID